MALADGPKQNTVIKFELLADLENRPAGVEISFNECKFLGAVNLRGTGFAAKDVEVRTLTAKIGGVIHTAEVNVTGLAGFLLAKCAAAYSRRKPKDWYDIAFVLLHNDLGGPERAAEQVKEVFGDKFDALRSALSDLKANFEDPKNQGPEAYAEQMLVDHPDQDPSILRGDAVIVVKPFAQFYWTFSIELAGAVEEKTIHFYYVA